MSLMLILYPVSIIALLIPWIVLLMVVQNVTAVIIFICYLFRLFSIKPLLTWIGDVLHLYFKDSIDRIKLNIRETFPVSGNMTNTKQAIYLLHPHGIFSLTHAFHINTDMTNWPYRNVRSVIHTMLKWIPFAADIYLNYTKMVDSEYPSMKKTLEEGESIFVCLGGVSESRYTEKNRITAVAQKRIGIFKMAIETGIPIIPVISYGEQSIFETLHTFGILESLPKIPFIDVLVPTLPTLSSVWEWMSIYKKPLDKKIHTHIGQLIDVGEARTPTSTEIEALRETYITALKTLYKKTRPTDYEEEIVIV
jgi:hypothetical protein